MDIYRQVLLKLYEVTGGKDSRALDFHDLVRGMGLNAHYAKIFDYLSVEGWIAEEPKKNFVRITHWGVAEAKKSIEPGALNPARDEDKSAENCVTLARELGDLLDNLVKNRSSENLGKVEKKLAALQAEVAKVRSKM